MRGMTGMENSIEDILIDCWRLMEDHEPEGWPAIQMKTVTALCDEVRRLTPKQDHIRADLERMRSSAIYWQDQCGEHEQARTALEEAVGQLLAEARELREVLAGVVACWNGPKYKHVMGLHVDEARAVLAKYHAGGSDR